MVTISLEAQVNSSAAKLRLNLTQIYYNNYKKRKKVAVKSLVIQRFNAYVSTNVLLIL